MTVIIVVACLTIAGSELYLARGARQVSDRLEKLEAVTLRQEERIESMTAWLKDTEPDPARRLSERQAAAGLTGASARPRGSPDGPQDDGNAGRGPRVGLRRALGSVGGVVSGVFRHPPRGPERALTQGVGGVPAGSEAADGVRPQRRGPRSARVAAALGVLLGASSAGGVVVTGIRHFLDYYSGVLALVALSLSVVAGLVATDRAILTVRHRILAQGLHRATTLVAAAFLLIHVLMRILTGDADVMETVLPFGRTVSLGLGTVAAQVVVAVILTGLVRGRFALCRRPGLWRAAHSLAYLGWVCAMLHGLLAGRRPATWVTWSYAGCAAIVGVALLARGLVTLRPRTAETRPPGPRPGDRTGGEKRDQWAKVPR
jgi:hypothetical protein